MQELVPYISCLVNPHEFDEALTSNYSEIYVSTEGGYYKHMKLRGGRHIRLKVPSLPKSPAVKEVSAIKEELNFLPDGKIPYEFLEQIIHFFKEVMRLKKAEYEAHAWILWNKDRGYYISIPKQTVSKASVQFSYDEEALPPDSIVVVDIHSHNTMGAFYSGTDNNNDKNGIYYSGVVGRLDQPTPQVVFRFNMHEVKQECKIPDIFEIEKKDIQIPQEWMDQVEVKTFTPTHYSAGGKPVAPTHQLSMWDSMMNQLTQNGRESPLRPRSKQRAIAESLLHQNDDDDEGRDYLTDQQIQELNDQAEEYLANQGGYIFVPSGHEDEEAAGPMLAVDPDYDQVGNGNLSDEYEYYKVNYGVEVAEAKDSIDSELSELADCEEALLDIIRTAYSMLGDVGRQDICTNGM